MGGDGMCTEALGRLAGDGLGEGKVICAEAGGVKGPQEKVMEDFRARYKKKFNMDVQLYAPYVYDSVMVMATAMQNAKSADPAKYLPVLKKIKYEGVTGTIQFDQGRHQGWRADPVHLQGRQAQQDRRGALKSSWLPLRGP
jgi:branched-chain amino acid transport system substrate-binding protein